MGFYRGLVVCVIVLTVATKDVNSDMRDNDQSYQVIIRNAINNINNRHKFDKQLWKQLKISEKDRTKEPLYKLQDLLSSYRRGNEHVIANMSSVLTSRLGTLLAESYNVSDTCMNQTLSIMQGILGQQFWAIMIIDTFGKLPSGIFTGNVASFGSYDECVQLKGYTTQGAFDLNTCVLATSILQVPVSLGICVPDSCSGQEIQTIISAGLSMLTPDADIPTMPVTCRGEDGPEIDGLTIGCMYDYRTVLRVALHALYMLYASNALKIIITENVPFGDGEYIIVCSIIAFFVVIGTAYDVINSWLAESQNIVEPIDAEKNPLINKEKPTNDPPEQGIIAKILLAFSCYTNGKKLLSTYQPAGALTSVNGIRFLSMSWVILGHTYIYIGSSTENYPLFLNKMIDRWTFQAITNALVSVDTFFALSGLLLTYLFMKEMDKKQSVMKFNWGMFYFHRFWRLTPPYMLVLFINVALARYFGDGPAWPRDGFEIDFCKDNWWTNLLYINNLVKADKTMCMGWSWYLANDMQFFIISPFMLIPLFLSPMIGIGCCLVFLLASWIATGVISSHFNLITSLFTSDVTAEEGDTYSDQYYMKPWCRIGPYIVGIVTGYILYKTKNGFHINKVLNLIGWIVATVLACTVLYGLYDSVSSEKRLSVGVAALYNTTHRTVWAACVCWVIFSCAKGYGGFINTILSWRGFIPLSRLTYCVYLIHPIIMNTVYFSRRRFYYLTDNTMIYLFFGNMVAAFAFGFITSLAFESPMMGLEKALLHKNKNK